MFFVSFAHIFRNVKIWGYTLLKYSTNVWPQAANSLFLSVFMTRNHNYMHAISNNYAIVNYSKTTNCTHPMGLRNFVGLLRNLLMLIHSNDTQNHVITCANLISYINKTFAFA